MTKSILQLESSEPKRWVAQAAPQQTTQTLPHQGLKLFGETLNIDGVGIGIGMTALLFLGIMAWAALQLAKNMNPAKIASEISQHMKQTECKLDRIDFATASSDRKIELLMSMQEKNAAMLREARAAGLEMSGQLTQIQDRVDAAIRTEIAKK